MQCDKDILGLKTHLIIDCGYGLTVRKKVLKPFTMENKIKKVFWVFLRKWSKFIGQISLFQILTIRGRVHWKLNESWMLTKLTLWWLENACLSLTNLEKKLLYTMMIVVLEITSLIKKEFKSHFSRIFCWQILCIFHFLQHS